MAPKTDPQAAAARAAAATNGGAKRATKPVAAKPVAAKPVSPSSSEASDSSSDSSSDEDDSEVEAEEPPPRAAAGNGNGQAYSYTGPVLADMLHGPLKKDEAEALLMLKGPAKDGTYLLRTKEKDTQDAYVLSVVHNDEPTHHLLKRRAPGASFMVRDQATHDKDVTVVVDKLARGAYAWWTIPLLRMVPPASDRKELKVLARRYTETRRDRLKQEKKEARHQAKVVRRDSKSGRPRGMSRDLLSRPSTVEDLAALEKQAMEIVERWDFEELHRQGFVGDSLLSASTESLSTPSVGESDTDDDEFARVHAPIPVEDVAQLLHGQPAGTYLLHHHPMEPQTYIMSVLYKDRLTHHMVKREGADGLGEFTLNNHELSEEVDNLSQLIEHLSIKRPYWPCPLQQPIFKHQIRALREEQARNRHQQLERERHRAREILATRRAQDADQHARRLHHALRTLLNPPKASPASAAADDTRSTHPDSLAQAPEFVALEQALSALEFAEKRYRQALRREERQASKPGPSAANGTAAPTTESFKAVKFRRSSLSGGPAAQAAANAAAGSSDLFKPVKFKKPK